MGEHDRALLGRDDPSRSHGAALGAGGVEGWWSWRSRRRLRAGIDAVSPGTWRGAFHVTLWFIGLAAIIGIGAAATGLHPFIWLVIGLVVVYGVGLWWERRDARRGPFA